MSIPAPDRRQFLRISAGAAFFGTASGLGALGELGRALAADALLEPELIQLSPELEPIVKTIEDMPRGTAIEGAADLLRSGVDYKRFLAALFLAGVRNVDSSNSGFSFHCVLAINSAHVLAMDSPASERLLPLFWALGQFKGAQRSQPRKMLTLENDRPPEGAAAIEELRKAVVCWDQARAECAMAGIARTCEPAQGFEGLWYLGARDIRPIGHKAIFVAQTWRTLQTIGWQHAEPALRSLGRSLAGYGPTVRNNGFAFDDQVHASNEELVKANAAKLPANWAEEGTPESAADAHTAAALLEPIRAARARQASAEAMAYLIGDADHPRLRAGAVWDIVHLAAAELIYRQPGIVAVHAVTSVNALHFGFRTTRSSSTRLFLLLQAVGWMAHFTHTTGLTSAQTPRVNILDLTPADGLPDDPVAATGSILSEVGEGDGWAMRAATRAFAYGQTHAGDTTLLARARSRVLTKAIEAHQYKYPAAAFEDIPAVSGAWRPHMLAASMMYLPAESAPDSTLMQRAREAVGGL